MKYEMTRQSVGMPMCVLSIGNFHFHKQTLISKQPGINDGRLFGSLHMALQYKIRPGKIVGQAD